MTEMTKSQLRARVRALFPTLSAEALAAADQAIQGHLIGLLKALGLRGSMIGGYQAIRRPSFSEPLIDWLACQQAAEVELAFPLVDSGTMLYRQAQGQACVPDALVIPAVGYDARGYRLGHGAGNFDQYLAQHSVPTTIGVVYAWQNINSIPTDVWDRPVAWIVTEDGAHKLPASGSSLTGRQIRD